MNDRGALSATLLRLALPLPYLFLLWAAYSVFAETVDDPYITFRYAAHLLSGHGPVFNLGERVEGYTSPLHLLLSAILLTIAPSVDILFKAKCASLLFAVIILAQTRTLARRSGLGAWEALLTQVLVALNINFALASVNALETTLYGGVLLAGLLVFQREGRTGRGSFSGLLFFLAVLARPEALLVGAALLLVRLAWARRRNLPHTFVLHWLGLFLAPLCAVEAARWGYYGQLLPNTYFAKAQSLRNSLTCGQAYPLRAMSPTPTALSTFEVHLSLLNRSNMLALNSLVQKNIRFDAFNMLMQILFWGLAFVGFWRTKRLISGVIRVAVVAAAFLFVFKSGGDWMYGWRFMVPVLPLLAVGQCYGVRVLSRVLVRRWRTLSWATVRHCGAAVVTVLWLVACAKTNHYSWKSVGFSTQGSRLLEASEGYGPLWVKGADYIRQLPSGTRVAYSEMGYAGYTNMDKCLLDIRGLTDQEIAHLPAAYKYSTGITDKDWYRPGDPLGKILQSRKPDVIISFDRAPAESALGSYRHRATVVLPVNSTQSAVQAYVFNRIDWLCCINPNHAINGTANGRGRRKPTASRG